MMKIKTVPIVLVSFSILSMLAAAVLFIAGNKHTAGIFLISAITLFSLFSMANDVVKRFSFTFWVFAFVTMSMVYPSAFGKWFGYDLNIMIVPLIQIITFGMGTTLSLKDFQRIFVMPWPVFIGFVGQFTVMPLVGLSIAAIFGFEPEVAAGVILIGSVPGGVASNLITYLAGGNVALSVTMTACSTLASPFMTPFLMKTLAGKLVPVEFVTMMLSIVNMIIVPIIAGLMANAILYGKNRRLNSARVLTAVTLISLALACFAFFTGPALRGSIAIVKDSVVVGSLLLGLVSLAKLVVDAFKGPENWMDRALPAVSMTGICLIIAIITARSSEKLMTIGVVLIFAAIIHNAFGYLLGYWLARAARLKEQDCRTVAIEVGLQNGGMASGLAMNVLHSTSAALAPAIFGPWMNISGSILASWWKRNPPEAQQPVIPETDEKKKTKEAQWTAVK